jgi:hypothetical protein
MMSKAVQVCINFSNLVRHSELTSSDASDQIEPPGACLRFRTGA